MIIDPKGESEIKTGKGIYALLVLACMTLLGVPAAFADVTVVYKMTAPEGNATQTIRYADKQHVRVDMTDVANHETSMMKLGDKVYMITGEVVQDMDQLAGMMAMMGKGAKSRHTEHAQPKYEDTGRTETIAGIKGKVYRFAEYGKQHEIVLGQDKDLQAAALGVVEIGKSMSAAMPADSQNMMQQNAPVKNMAMLRLDDRVRLQSINHDRIQASTFVLPAEPQQLGGGMGALFGR